MKKITFILIAMFLVIKAQSQIINVCGTDTIILEVENYDNKGTVEWQESIDSINWVTIPEVVGEAYKFFPIESKYYRSVVKTSICDPLYSSIAFVQLPPVANAGTDREIGGNTMILMGNQPTGTIGDWMILSGDSGLISEPSNPYSEFSGKYDEEYQLIWTITNACGISSDTVKIVFKEISTIQNFIIIDNTDSIYSDSIDIEDGIYKIKFSDQNIIPYDSVILIGIRENMSFLRKVESFNLLDSIYTFFTVQGNFEDLFSNGVVNIGDAVNQSIIQENRTSVSSKIKRFNTFPTRETILANANNKGLLILYSNNYEIDDHLERRKVKSINTTNGVKLSLPDLTIFKNQNKSLEVSIKDSYVKIDPNFVVDLKFSKFAKFQSLQIGLDNTLLEFNYKTKFAATLAVDFFSDKQKLVRLTREVVFMAGAVPVIATVNFEILASCYIKMGPGVLFENNNNYKTYLTAMVVGNDLQNLSLISNQTSSNTPEFLMSVRNKIDSELKIGPEISFRIYDIIGPYFSLPLKLETELCHNTDSNWSCVSKLSVAGNLGAKITMLGSTFFDYKYELFKPELSYKVPYKVELLSGNYQSGLKDQFLSKPISVKVTSSGGFGVPLVPVRIEIEDGNGSVNENVVFTNLIGIANFWWKLGPNTDNKLKIYVYDCDNRNIENSPIYVFANSEPDQYDCSNNNLNISLKSDSINLFPMITGGNPPYVYSIDGENYNNNIPLFDLFISGDYSIYVKDSKNCIAVRNFKITGKDTCLNSNLKVSIFVQKNTMQMTGHGGFPPYDFALDSAFNFSNNNYFNKLQVGEHIAFVRDSKGCTRSSKFNIEQEETAAISPIYPANNAKHIPTEDISLRWLAGNYAPNQLYSVNIRKQNEPPFGPPEFDLTTPEYTIPQQLDYGSTYFWEVIVKNQQGQYIDSREFSFTTTTEVDNIIPKIPILYFPENNSSTQSLPQWFVWGSQFHEEDLWFSQFGIFVYDLYLDLDNNNATRRIANNISDTTFIVNSLVENQKYYWKVVVKNRFTGEFKVSPVYSFTYNKIGEVFNPLTGKTWMDRNLGASRVATSSTDTEAYGDLYQWGRGTDGHEKRSSEVTSTRSSSDTPGHGKFITTSTSPYDWRSSQNDNLWQGVNGTNNPCPEGFRIPTAAEWNAERASWSSNTSGGAFASPLKLPVAGYRGGGIGQINASFGYYWSSTVDGTYSRILYFSGSDAGMYSGYRARGYSVRCLKDD